MDNTIQTMSYRNNIKIWDFFSKLPGTEKMANCNQCFKDFSYKTSVTNLKTHLRLKHVKHYNWYISDKSRARNCTTPPYLPTTPTTIQRCRTYGSPKNPQVVSKPPQVGSKPIILVATSSAAHEAPRRPLCGSEKTKIDGMLLKLIAKTYLPVSMVEQIDFIEFVQSLNPHYDLPERKIISESLIPSLYKKCLNDQKEIIKHKAKTVCLTTDCWTSIKMNTFIAITAHFINERFQFKSVLLKCSEVKGAHTSQNLAAILSETCTEWEISDKINFCVTDNAANIIGATKILEWNHCGCIAHNLNLVLQNSLGSINATLKKVKKIVVHFRSSDQAKEQLIDYQSKVQGSSQPLELIASVPTRWNSTFHMVERFIKLQDAVSATIPNLDVDLPVITSTEWTALRQLSKVLKPFNEATIELSTDKYVCASKAIPVINGLKDVLLELKKRSEYCDAIKQVVECIETDLHSRFHELEYKEYLALCTILDPRYKMSMFIAEDAAVQAKLHLVATVLKLIKEEAEPIIEVKKEPEETSEIRCDIDEVNLWRRRNLILEQRTVNSNQDEATLAQKEVDSYLHDEFADSGCDPCQWWLSVGQIKYPHLGEIFKTSCNIVATSVPSERLFSKAGYTLSERRTRLSVRKTEQLVFLNANLKNRDYERLVNILNYKNNKALT